MFDRRSEEHELMDDLSLSGDELRKNLAELSYTNRIFGSKRLLINALNKVHQKYRSNFLNNKITIADLGSGGGDLLTAVDDWAKSNKLTVELIGIDANPFMTQYAKNATHSYPNIQFRTLNIHSPEFRAMTFDIVTINSISHHFNSTSLIELYKQLSTQTRLAIIINDLHRHWVSYYSIKWLSRLLKFSYLGRHDGCLSVLRAFRKQELKDIIKAAGISSYDLHWRWAFRWEMIIWLSK